MPPCTVLYVKSPNRSSTPLYRIQPCVHGAGVVYGSVGACDLSITDACDESGSARSWIKVVSKKQKNKADGLMVATNLGGKQSEKLEKLTLFTKSKLAK